MAEAAEDFGGEVLSIPQFRSNGLREAETMRRVWVAIVDQRVVPEHLLIPEFWTHVSRKLNPFDKIEVRRADREFYAELIVLDVGSVWARCTLLGVWPLGDANAYEVVSQEAMRKATRDYKIDFRGSAGWSVVRMSDTVVMIEHLPTRDQAEDWLRAWARKTMSAPEATPMPDTMSATDKITDMLKPGRGVE